MISIIVPVFNEENNIGNTLTSLTNTLQDLPCPYEIIVVNDGSTDGTGDILTRRDSIRLVSYTSNRGKGYAVKTGIAAARGEFVGFIDGDGEIDPAYLADFYREISAERYDVIIGRKVGLKRNPLRKIYSQGFRFLVWLLFGIKADTQTGIKLFNSKIKMFSPGQCDGYLYDLEMLIACSDRNYSIKEMPVVLSDVDKLNRISFCEVMKIIKDMVNLKIRRNTCSGQESYGYYSLL